MMNVRIKTMPVMRLAALRHVGPYHHIGEAFGRLSEWVACSGIPHGPSVAVFHDCPKSTPQQDLRSDACVEVGPEVAFEVGDVRVLEIPANTYAVYTHVGSYEQLGEAWSRFVEEWFPTSGYRTGAGVCFERYLNSPCEVPEAQLVTELYEPISVDSEP